MIDRHEWRAIHERLSPAEIALILEVDPCWQLPGGSLRAVERVTAANAILAGVAYERAVYIAGIREEAA